MVVADCESELVRDGSRGLAGGAFFMATLLNRKEAKTARGKDDIDSLKDFILLKGDVRFCQYFIRSKNLDPEVDNTPDNIKTARADQKVAYFHKYVGKLDKEKITMSANWRTGKVEKVKVDTAGFVRQVTTS